MKLQISKYGFDSHFNLYTHNKDFDKNKFSNNDKY